MDTGDLFAMLVSGGVIAALVQGLKRFTKKLPRDLGWVPAVLIGLLLGIVAAFATHTSILTGALYGFMTGLISSGLYSNTKNTGEFLSFKTRSLPEKSGKSEKK